MLATFGELEDGEGGSRKPRIFNQEEARSLGETGWKGKDGDDGNLGLA